MKRMRVFIFALGALAIIGGGARSEITNTRPTRLYPQNYATAPAKSGAPLTASIETQLGESLANVLKAVTREDVRLANARVFKEYGPGNVSTSCGLAWVYGNPGFYILQTDDDGLIYVSVRPSQDEIRTAGCLRPDATWEYQVRR